MNGATFLVKALINQGVKTVYGYPGGAIMPLYDALLDVEIEHILVRHEQAAAFAAQGYARVTGQVGVCWGTSGPGATNLITGVADAFTDSVPLVIITGQVPCSILGTDAFQEVDVIGMSLPYVKHSFLPKTTEELPGLIEEAFAIASSGRPGPVWIDIPKDVMQHEMKQTAFDSPDNSYIMPELDPAEIHQAKVLISQAKKPLIYAGGGISLAKAVPAFRRFVHDTGLPTVMTLKGLGALPGDNPLALGMLGMHGLKAANYAVQHTDLLIVVGARFDDRVTGRLSTFAPHAKVIHLDIDSAEIGKLRRPDVILNGSLTESLAALTQPMAIEPWKDQCRAWKKEFVWVYPEKEDHIHAPRLIHQLSERAGGDVIVSCDVGQHQMWVAQHFAFTHPTVHLTSGGFGTMGFGLPAAIGAQKTCPDKTVIAVCGDGSFMMNVQELATMKRYGIPVKILLLDNSRLGMVKQWQELFFEERYSEVDLDDNPDFAKVARAFGIRGVSFDHSRDEEEICDLLLNEQGPVLVHVKIRPEDNVWPLVPPGKSNLEMMEGAAK